MRPRPPRRPLVAAALGLTLVLTQTGPLPAAAAAAAAPAANRTAAGPPTTVTLITGDKVVVAPDGTVSATAGPGRDRTAFKVTQQQGHQFVVPLDAEPMIIAGKLDKRLFDVTLLVEFQYDDAHRPDIPVLVRGKGQRAITKSRTANTLWRQAASFDRIWLDGKRKLNLDRSVAQVGAPTAWAAGYTGTGVKVAVLDSGVDKTHPDLAGQVVAEKNFTTSADTDDKVGHGTHVAATIASTDAKYRGVAPDADLLIGKVCGTDFCSDSAILDGMNWAADQGAKIVNMSLGSYDSPGIDPLEEAVDRLSAERGMLFVISAGNAGPGGSTLGSPGTADAALTVGAVDRTHATADFSSRGPRAAGGLIKPEISAPGTDIAAARAANGTIGRPADDPAHVRLSGTSMAAPHVAGAAALLAQQHPHWSGATIKAALMASARPSPAASVFEQGAGRVDLTRAITQTVTSTPVSLSLGTQLFPHGDDVPVHRTLTYANTASDQVTLDVAVETTAPAGVFSVSPPRVTVPAGGTASVEVTANTQDVTTYGTLQGAVIATGDQTVARTPLEILNEDETYELTVTTLNSTGKTQAAWLNLYHTDRQGMQSDAPSDDAGVTRFRAPKGTYGLTAQMTSPAEVNIISYPRITLDRDMSVTVDARDAGPIDISVADDRTVTDRAGAFNVAHVTERGGFRLQYLVLGGFSTGRVWRIGRSGPAPADGELAWNVHSVWASTPDGAGTTQLYALGWDFPNQLPAGLHRHVTHNQLAQVTTTIPATAQDDRLYVLPWLDVTSRPIVGPAAAAIEISGTRRLHTHFTTSADGAKWRLQYNHYSPTFEPRAILYTPFATHSTGSRRTTSALGPVWGPTNVWIGDRNDMYREQNFVQAGGLFAFGDGAGNRGYTPMTSYGLTMARVDKPEVIPQDAYGRFLLAAEPSRYRLTLSATRGGAFELSTRVNATWEFDSAYTAVPTPLPTSLVRFHPELDAAGAAPAGRSFTVPLAVQQYEGGSAGRTSRITAQVSYDDGVTWLAARVNGKRMLLRHPAKAGYVSLRAQAVDTKGNIVTTTTIRAYKLA